MTSVGSMISQGFFYTFEPRTEWLTLLPGLVSQPGRRLLWGGCVAPTAFGARGWLAGRVHHSSFRHDLGTDQARVPHWFAFMLTLALRFLPETIEQGKRILVAQQLRGAGGKRHFSAARRFRFLIVPLLAASIRSARQVAMAAEVRAYSPERSSQRSAIFDGRLGDTGRAGNVDPSWLAAAVARVRRIDGRDLRDLVLALLGFRLGCWSGASGMAVFLALRKRAFQPLTTLGAGDAGADDLPAARRRGPLANGSRQGAGARCTVFSIPYTAIFLLGLRLVPKPGVATLLIFGQGLFGQLLGRGINPAWWPYYLMCAAGVEILLLLVGNSMRSAWTMLAAGVLRGVGGLLLYVSDPGPVPVAPVLRLVVRRAQVGPGGRRLLDRRLVGLAAGAAVEKATRLGYESFSSLLAGRFTAGPADQSAEDIDGNGRGEKRTEPSANSPFAPPGCMRRSPSRWCNSRRRARRRWSSSRPRWHRRPRPPSGAQPRLLR